jgi:3-hydroxybutyryl-CoA dehydratase
MPFIFPHGKFFDDLSLGMTAAMIRTVTDDDIVKFAELTGDANPVHLNEAYAEATQFGSRIAHGMFAAGLISAVLGTKLPGPGTIYLSQELKFRAPVYIGDTVVARVKVEELVPEKARVRFSTTCTVQDKVVVEGMALAMVPKRTQAA